MNVISINDRDAIASAASPRRAQLLGSVRECASRLLGEAFRQMLERADDVLFEFAEKAETNAQQTLYFDAMRELRLKHNQMNAVFVDRFGTGFDARRRRGSGSRGSVAAMPTKLSLLDDATMEQDITTAGLAERIATACREELFALNRRLSVLLEIPELSSEDNPLGPTCIAEAARDAANGLDVDFKARLIVLKLFDRYVVSGIPEIYGAVNQHLIQQGVLPTIQTEVRRRPPGGGRGGTGAAHSAGTPASQAEIMVMLEKLLRGGGEPDSVHGTVPLIPLDTGVMGMLTHLQRNGGGGGPSGVAAHLLVDLQRSGDLPAMGPAGDMTIDIVAMLFDYVLEDKNVPEGIRAKLARLQIPILKVALIDREFFSRKTHPARRLLNHIAETAVEIGGDAIMEAKVAELVDEVVQRIVTDFDQDVAIFTRSVEALTKAFDELKREATVRASRTAKMLDGRARLEQAKEQVRNLLDTRLRPDGIPDVVRNFLLMHWRRLLITHFTTDGADSDAWRTAVRTMDELVWSTLPKRGSEERQKLGRLLPKLLANLKKGMEQVSMPAVARNGFLLKLEKSHAEAMRGESAAAAKNGAPVLTGLLATTAEDPPPLVNEEPSVLDITTGEMSGDVEEMIAGESPPEPPASREITEPLATALIPDTGDFDIDATSESEPAAHPQPMPVDLMRPPETVESQEPVPESALQLPGNARSAAEELRERLAMSEEVKLSEVMPPASDLPPPSVQAARKERSVLEMTANTFYRLFAQDASREAKAAATQDLEFEELTLGDTRNPVVAQQEDAHLLQVMSLEPGTWLEFKQPDGTTIAGRYTYYTPETETYVFSDRSGRRLTDRTRNGLVTDFRRGTACVTQQPAALLDRAFTRLLDPSTWVARRR
ncbi:MAG: hypothetical protein NFCOHLIN_01835 [Gammaproteobacteria bacterium]|nr:hypothetical protein [Gammaproteobacteria bacterium]